jgi:hypothetical protein
MGLPRMSHTDFKKLFGTFFTAFIVIIMLIFLLISIYQKANILTTLILIIIPLGIRYAIYRLTNL